MKVILSHPTGNANVRAAANGLNKANLLYLFYTSIASFPGSLQDDIGRLKPFSEIRRRRFDIGLKQITKIYPWIEIGRLLASKLALYKLTSHETGLLSLDSVYRAMDRHVSQHLKGSQAIYAYEDGAAFSFQKAKELRLQCLYDLPIGYWKEGIRILEIEKDRSPEWSSTLSGLKDSTLKLERKDEELRLADRIFVASKFTAKTLEKFKGPLAPIEVIPYGFPPVNYKLDYSFARAKNKIKLLFVGSLSQRKGIAYLFEAIEKLKDHVELTLIGHKTSNNCAVLDAAIARHRWIPSLPHNEILNHMQASDVLIFPSLFEGFGLVITEAMSQGTPVITTDRTAGPDFIEHGRNGWLVEASSTLAIQEAIEELLHSPKKIKEAGHEALKTALNRPWQVYGEELAQAVYCHVESVRNGAKQPHEYLN